MSPLVLALALALPPQGEVHEYAFRHGKAALFLHRRWRDLQVLFPDLQLAKSRKSPPNGPRVYLDEKRNTLVFSSPDETAGYVASQMMPEFDVAPKPVRLAVSLSRPEFGLETKAQIETVNGESAIIGSTGIGAIVDLRALWNNDGTVRLILQLKSLANDEKASCSARLAIGFTKFQIVDGKGYLVNEKPLAKGEAISNPPAGDVWKPFKIEVTAYDK